MENATIKNKEGAAIPISAFGTITHSLNDVKTVSRTNGEPSVQLNVIKTPSANISDVAEQVKDRVSHLHLDTVNPKDVSFHILLDREKELNSSLFGLVREGSTWLLVFNDMCVLLLPKCKIYLINCDFAANFVISNNSYFKINGYHVKYFNCFRFNCCNGSNC